MNGNLKLSMDSMLDSLAYSNNTITITGDLRIELKITSRASKDLLLGLIEELSPQQRENLIKKMEGMD